MAMEEVFSLTNILLMVSILINIVTMIFVVKKRGPGAAVAGRDRGSQQQGAASASVEETAGKPVLEAGVVFCRNCGNQYESTERVCPGCRTPR